MHENSTDTHTETQSELRFGPFRLEAVKQLWRSNQLVDLRPRSLAMLRYLAERPDQLITKKELLTQLWPGIYVSSTVVKVCVREIRHALGDETAKPQFIETVGVQGYRFIAPLTSSPPVSGSKFQVARLQIEEDGRRLETRNLKLETPFVGREHELAQLQTWCERAQQGERQIIFVSGEAGIGKTTLVEHFLAQVQPQRLIRIGHGRCVEQGEQGEAYLPVLQALQQLCSTPDGDQVVAILRRYAPLWLVQLSGVLEADELETLQRQVQGSSPQRMLREFAAALEQLAAEAPLLLCLEDLQWSDGSTLELIAYLAQRRAPARLLVIGTYRLAETVISGHPLRRVIQEMVGRGPCQELALELFTEAEVAAYLSQRLTGSPVGAVLWPVIYRCTQGNALFVRHFVDYLIQRGLLVETGGQWELREEPATLEALIPDHVQRLIARQVDGLSKEVRQLLEVASVVGMTFTASEIAAVANSPLEATEAVYDELASQGRFIEVQGLAEWPDGSLTVRYHFRHALYQRALYHRIGLAQRVRWHRQLGEHFATLYGERTQEIAGELAFHFERGRDYWRAIFYRQQAGEHALQQSAYQKALGHGQGGLALLAQLPATAERGHLELNLRQLVIIALGAHQGYTDNELEDNLRRTQQLCRELEDVPTLVSVVISLARLQLYRAHRPALEELIRQEEELAERLQDPSLLVQLHTQLMASETVRGRHTRAREHYQQVLGHYNPQARQFSPAFLAGDPFVGALGVCGLSLSLSGWLDQGWSRLAQGLARAEESAQYIILANGLLLAVPVKSLRGELEEAWQLAKKMVELTREHDFPLYGCLGVLLQGGMAVQCGALEEGIAALTSGLAQYRALRAQFFVPYFLSLLAEGYRQQGKVAEALQVVSEALSLTTTNFDVFWEAELYRLKGELLLNAERMANGKEARPKLNDERKTKKKGQTSSPIHHSSFIIHRSVEAEACFLKAIEIARRQEAKLLELRATMSLAHLWQQQRKKKEARQLLSEIYNWFTEGLDTKDLQAAKALLAELT
jgi:DNA-binding winged helix-turn-helix (wHTH) protein/tetratricopeptide (TPR) repeat protein